MMDTTTRTGTEAARHYLETLSNARLRANATAATMDGMEGTRAGKAMLATLENIFTESMNRVNQGTVVLAAMDDQMHAEVLKLKYIDRMTWHQVANAVGFSPRTAQYAARLGLQELARILDEETIG